MLSTRTLLIRSSVAVAVAAMGATLMSPVGATGDVSATRASTSRLSGEDLRLDTTDALRYRSKHDPRGDIKRPQRDAAIDIRRVQAWPHVDNKPSYLAVRISGYNFPNASNKRNVADVYFNMANTGPRPDFRVIKYLPRDGDGLEGSFVLETDGWKNSTGVRRCRDLLVTFNSRRDSIGFFVPRGCVSAKHGRRFQVHARVWNITEYTQNGQAKHGRFDEVPNRFLGQGPRFLPVWV
jgi:hypothetical protein